MKAFIYQWAVHEEVDDRNDPKSLWIHGYGINEKNDNVCLRIQNFYPWISIELQNILSYNTLTLNRLKEEIEKVFSLKGKILQDKLYTTKKMKLYFDQNNQKFTIYRMFFKTLTDRKRCYYKIKNKSFKIGTKHTKILAHEHEASPILQFLCKKNIPSCGWVEFKGMNVNQQNRFTKNSKEYKVNISQIEGLFNIAKVPEFRFMSFDLEVYSSDDGRMPQSHLDTDCIFQIGVYTNYGGGRLLTLGKTMFDLPSTQVSIFENEKQLLESFCKLIVNENPHVLLGYNIFKFDVPYLVNRCKRYKIPIDSIGMPKEKKAEFKEVKWSSSAYAFQEFYYLDLEGRLSIDLLPLIKRDYKFSNYKLGTVSDFFLGDTKDPMTPRQIFDAYRTGVLKNKVSKVQRCGKYCVQDAKLVHDLFSKIQAWIGLIEMAKICNVGIMPLFTQGQQIKIFSQVFKKCYQEDRIVDSFSAINIPKNIVFEFDKYCGAYVFPPVPGKYNMVIPFDFTSLYPTTIIAYNIDYSTLVYDENVPDSECNVIEWNEDGVEYRYRFRKEPIGVIPSLLKSLLQQRNETKRQLKNEKDPTVQVVLDKRQLAYKVSANSMYGGMGVRKGYLPFLPGAMCTTAKGRESIQNAAKFVQNEHEGQIVYGDSVTKDTILSIKENNLVRLLSIENLFIQGTIQSYPQFKAHDLTLCEKQQSTLTNPKRIYTRKGWANIKRVIRHKTLKSIYNIKTTSGMVKITEDHSLLLENGQCIRPVDVQSGKHVLMTCKNLGDICNHLEFQKESWNGIWYIADQKIFFHQEIDDKYLLYIYLSFKKEYPNMVFCINEGKYYLDLINKSNIQEGLVLSVDKISDTKDYVYDIETEDGSFHAGVGSLIIKNTDSIYCHFPKYTTTVNAWTQAKNIEEEFIKLFPPPMKLIFEDKIYLDFLILTKKRYMAFTCGQDGILDKNMTTRGVLLARRDNCLWLRELYEKLVRSIMEKVSFATLIEQINTEILHLFQWHPKNKNIFKFVVSKLLSHEYKIKALPEDPTKCKKRLKDLDIFCRHDITNSFVKEANSFLMLDDIVKEFNDCVQEHGYSVILSSRIFKEPLQTKYKTFSAFLKSNFQNDVMPPKHEIEKFLRQVSQTFESQQWIQQYRIKSQPAHAQLNEKMKIRGTPISAGSRMEYVIVEHFLDPKGKLFDKLEDPDYFSNHCDIYRLDRLYYLKNCYTPFDQLFEICFKKKNVIKNIYEQHLQHKKFGDELKARTGVIIHYNS